MCVCNSLLCTVNPTVSATIKLMLKFKNFFFEFAYWCLMLWGSSDLFCDAVVQKLSCNKLGNIETSWVVGCGLAKKAHCRGPGRVRLKCCLPKVKTLFTNSTLELFSH